MSSTHVLIIEDNPADADLIQLELKCFEEFTFDRAVSFNDFKTLYVPAKYSAILSDYNLSGSFGTEILEYVRKSDSRIPFIIISGAFGEGRAAEVLKKGATDYVLKDELNKLPIALTRAINKARTRNSETEALQETAYLEGHFRMLVENSAGLITIFTEDGQFTYCSPNVERILGFTEEEFLKKNCMDLIPIEHHNSAKETCRNAFNSPDRHFTFIHKYLTASNGYRIIESSARSTVNSAGHKILILNSNDITEKFESEKKLRISDEILNRVLSLVIMVNVHNDVSYVSPSVIKVLGYEPEELLGKGWWEKTTDSAEEAEKGSNRLKMLLKNGISEKERYNERLLRTKGGEMKWIAWEKSMTPDGCIIGVGQDITEIKKLEREKIEMQQKSFSMLEGLVTQRTEQVVSQQKIIEQKNKDFTDSIRYAKRLQDAILPTIEHISSVFSENFIFYRPKDIVAGDFFWAHESENHFMIAVADCTGHGVPGAMVSVVCSNALERAVNECQLVDPGKILDKATEIVLETFERSMEIVNDGMDISFLVIKKDTREIFWAGANIALYFMENDQMHKLHPNKQPIGSFPSHVPFTTHQLKNSSGMVYYLLSDGFADQFGGPRGKKFMKKRLAELLFNSRRLSLSEQHKILKNVFSDWKGDYEQVDDVTIIGLRLDEKFISQG